MVVWRTGRFGEGRIFFFFLWGGGGAGFEAGPGFYTESKGRKKSSRGKVKFPPLSG